MELELGLVEQLADGQQSIFFLDDFLLELLISAFQRPFGWVVLSFPAHLLFVPQCNGYIAHWLRYIMLSI